MALKTDREKTAHLLRRFGLGASEAELDYYVADGYKGAIDKLLNYENNPEVDLTVDEMRRDNQNNNIPMPLLQAHWVLHMAATRRPLEAKMALFWHDHFATSAQKVTATPMMSNQIDLLRANATGKFRTLLGEVSKDPAMLFWLDNQYNVKGKPNENFAREVMELFTLGIGHYTEKDIQEAARAFTGWTLQRRRPGQDVMTPKGKLVPNATFAFVLRNHDDGEKTILGNTGRFNGDDVLGILCGNPRTSVYLTEKIWKWFVYPEPSNTTIERHARKFRDSGLDIKVLLRSIMEDPEFVSDKAERALYKCPVDFCVACLRQLGVGEPLAKSLRDAARAETPPPAAARGNIVPVLAAQQAMKSMGMDLLFPPDVDGWQGGRAWITSATMVERIGWADRIFPLTAPANAIRSRKAVFRYPVFGLIASNPTPQHLVDKLVSIFDAPIPKERRATMVQAAQKVGSSFNQQTATTAANSVARLIFGSPEFQFA